MSWRSKKEKQIKHLLSPYNIEEAKRVQELRNTIITVILLIMLGLGIVLFVFWQK